MSRFSPVSRRRILAGTGAILSSLTGCQDLDVLEEGVGGDDGNGGNIENPPDGWPMAGRGPGNSAYAPDATPPDSLSIAWEQSVSGEGNEGSIVADSERVYVVSDRLDAFARDTGEHLWDAPDLHRSVAAWHDVIVAARGNDGLVVGVDPTSGEERWTTRIDEGPEPDVSISDDDPTQRVHRIQIHDGIAYVTHSIVLESGHVSASVSNLGVVDLNDVEGRHFSEASGPVAVEETTIWTVDGGVRDGITLNRHAADTGDVQSVRYLRGAAVPRVVDDTLYLGLGRRIRSFGPGDSDMASYEALGMTPSSFVASREGVVLANSGNLIALDASLETELWSLDSVGQHVGIYQSNGIVIAGDTVLVTNGQKLLSINLQTGEQQWTLDRRVRSVIAVGETVYALSLSVENPTIIAIQ